MGPYTTNPPLPSPVPASRNESKSIGSSSRSGVTTVFDVPEKIAFMSVAPAMSTSRVRSDVPSGSS